MTRVKKVEYHVKMRYCIITETQCRYYEVLSSLCDGISLLWDTILYWDLNMNTILLICRKCTGPFFMVKIQ